MDGKGRVVRYLDRGEGVDADGASQRLGAGRCDAVAAQIKELEMRERVARAAPLQV